MELWMYVGSQHLYGPEPLKEVHDHGETVSRGLDASPSVPYPVVFKGVLTTAAEISAAAQCVNEAERCVGVILWMHTFSPAKMWIAGLTRLQRPVLHLHTQFNRDVPWRSIDMDFMNLNQTAHGGREFGHVMTRMNIDRKIVVGHWQSDSVHARVGAWARAAGAHAALRDARFARFGDNMRNVAVTDGDKVGAEIAFGYSVNGFGIGDLLPFLNAVPEHEIDEQIERYMQAYRVAPELHPGGDHHDALRDGARQELGLRSFLQDGGFAGFTDTFEDLHGLSQLPGLAVQRLMEEGYGFGAEGDWKTAALLYGLKVMGQGLPGGTSFMEDYTYHFEPGRERVIGAHMLEVCPSIAADTPSLEIHPLGIGGKSAPVRLVFDAKPGPAINASMIQLGDHHRLVANTVNCVAPDEEMPNLPVARAVWIPEPDLQSSAAAWMYAGGAHHTVFSHQVTAEMLEDYAMITGVEWLMVDAATDIGEVRRRVSTRRG